MKKAYSKPQILFDSFELSQNIASCAIISNHVRHACGMELDPISIIFTDSVGTACTMRVPDDNEWGVCYEIPAEDNSLFSS